LDRISNGNKICRTFKHSEHPAGKKLVHSCKTIIATNLGINLLSEYYDERIVSRIIGGFDLFRFAGNDIRVLKKTAQHVSDKA